MKENKTKSLGHAEHSKAQDVKREVTQIRKLKIVFLGAGSNFFIRLFKDLVLTPGITEGEMCLVEPVPERLALAVKVAEYIMRSYHVDCWKIRAVSDRRKVLKNADYVISCIEVNGRSCVGMENDIPAKYGVDQCIGDTTGPGGVMKALRTVPTWLRALKDISELCPKAIVLNYTNPMSIMCLAAFHAFPQLKHYGVCHSVQGTSHVLAEYSGTPYDEMTWECAGINHLSWFTRLEHNGKDLYPVIRKRLKTKETDLARDPVRFNMMSHFGAFVTESSGHFSEYLPYYRKRKDLIEKHCGPGYNGETSFYARNWPSWRVNTDQFKVDFVEGKHPEYITNERSWEYATHLIEAIEKDQPFFAHLNVPNNGLIANLPANGIVEVKCVADRTGITPTQYGKLPDQMAAVCVWNMHCYELAAQACIDFDLEKAAQAMMLDPNTASVCSPEEIRRMAYELFDAERPYLDAEFFKNYDSRA